ncbi:anthranilate synthase component II [Streptomyces sp. 24-1644]|uniref:anthranilate synthase component II n=1 Tax=Streptomyces sp. 24-1644 TaxID=3457315 RepID=UPI003FA69FB7
MSLLSPEGSGRGAGKPHVLVVDAFDSFVDILRQYLLSAGAEPAMVRSHRMTPDEMRLMRPDAVLLGPGPGHPDTSGHIEIVRAFAGKVPLLGVCLGHQAIARAHGAATVPARHLMHGKTSRITHDGRGVFAGLPNGFSATRYHSLIVPESTVPPSLEVTARSADDGYVMGLRHRSLPVESVQFHPESFRTEHGMPMIRNFLASVRPFAARDRTAEAAEAA